MSKGKTSIKKSDVNFFEVLEHDIFLKNRKDNKYFTALKETKASNSLVKWVEFDREKLEGKVLALPTREDIDSQIAEHMIVELYSK